MLIKIIIINNNYYRAGVNVAVSGRNGTLFRSFFDHIFSSHMHEHPMQKAQFQNARFLLATVAKGNIHSSSVTNGVLNNSCTR